MTFFKCVPYFAGYGTQNLYKNILRTSMCYPPLCCVHNVLVTCAFKKLHMTVLIKLILSVAMIRLWVFYSVYIYHIQYQIF